MPLLKLSRASLAFGHLALLEQIDFQLDAGERVALIGRNGTGKSSLLAAIAAGPAAQKLDDGDVWWQPGIRLCYVPQEPVFDVKKSVFEAVVSGMGENAALLNSYHQVAHTLAHAAENTREVLLIEMARLQHALEDAGAWTQESAAERAIAEVGLDPDAIVGTLSGGQKKRLALAEAFSMNPEVLLLDEPTNHLDIAGIDWLEKFLQAQACSILFITHDRAFLDKLCTRIVELDRGKLQSFPGAFSGYLQQKEQHLHEEDLATARADKKLKAEEIWIRQGVEARRTRAVFRVQRLEKLRAERAARRARLSDVKLNISRGEAGGKLVAELDSVSKAWLDHSGVALPIVRDFSIRIQRGDKIGIIGNNGVGKTTLLRLILGEIAPDSGKVRAGTGREVAYFDQFRQALDEDARLVDVISPGSDYVTIGKQKKHVMGYLEDFLFSPERARSPVSSLSGGERNRLLLARLFAKPANVLLLDEPTNDLDMDTLELLETLLQDYDGTVFLVSHDRTFLDNVVTQSIVAEGEGFWKEYAGGYSDWRRYQDSQNTPLSPKQRCSSKTPKTTQDTEKNTKPSDKQKLNWKETRELAALPQKIAELETEQKQLTEKLADSAFYEKDRHALDAAAHRIAAIDEELLRFLEHWEMLENRQKATPSRAL